MNRGTTSMNWSARGWRMEGSQKLSTPINLHIYDLTASSIYLLLSTERGANGNKCIQVCTGRGTQPRPQGRERAEQVTVGKQPLLHVLFLPVSQAAQVRYDWVVPACYTHTRGLSKRSTSAYSCLRWSHPPHARINGSSVRSIPKHLWTRRSPHRSFPHTPPRNPFGDIVFLSVPSWAFMVFWCSCKEKLIPPAQTCVIGTPGLPTTTRSVASNSALDQLRCWISNSKLSCDIRLLLKV